MTSTQVNVNILEYNTINPIQLAHLLIDILLQCIMVIGKYLVQVQHIVDVVPFAMVIMNMPPEPLYKYIAVRDTKYNHPLKDTNLATWTTPKLFIAQNIAILPCPFAQMCHCRCCK